MFYTEGNKEVRVLCGSIYYRWTAWISDSTSDVASEKREAVPNPTVERCLPADLAPNQ